MLTYDLVGIDGDVIGEYRGSLADAWQHLRPRAYFQNMLKQVVGSFKTNSIVVRDDAGVSRPGLDIIFCASGTEFSVATLVERPSSKVLTDRCPRCYVPGRFIRMSLVCPQCHILLGGC